MYVVEQPNGYGEVGKGASLGNLSQGIDSFPGVQYEAFHALGHSNGAQ